MYWPSLASVIEMGHSGGETIGVSRSRFKPIAGFAIDCQLGGGGGGGGADLFSGHVLVHPFLPRLPPYLSVIGFVLFVPECLLLAVLQQQITVSPPKKLLKSKKKFEVGFKEVFKTS